MKIDMNKQYRTRDGREVRVLCTDADGEKCPVIALVGTERIVCRYTPFGENIVAVINNRAFADPDYDLVPVPEKRTVWVNVYGNGDHAFFKTRNLADDRARSNFHTRLTCIEVQYEVPEVGE